MDWYEILEVALLVVGSVSLLFFDEVRPADRREALTSEVTRPRSRFSQFAPAAISIALVGWTIWIIGAGHGSEEFQKFACASLGSLITVWLCATARNANPSRRRPVRSLRFVRAWALRCKNAPAPRARVSLR